MNKHVGLSSCVIATMVFLNSIPVTSVANNNSIEEVVVTGNIVGNLELESESSTSSRLGLSLMETPATVDVLTSDVMEARGYQKLSDAVGSQAGVITGGTPAGSSLYSMRGFDRSQITQLRDGLWYGPAGMIMRPQNTFNLERVEILRGPASVLHGNGAVAGTINTVNKTAKITDKHEFDMLVGYGRWDSTHLGGGAGGPITDELFYRLDISDHRSDGYVDRADGHSTNVTGSLLWQTNENFNVKLSIDYLEDELPGYFGTPLIPNAVALEPATNALSTTIGETIDLSTRKNNYNVEDGVSEADQLFLRADVQWSLQDNIELNGSLYRYTADRHWKNAEGYTYCTEVVGVCDAESLGQIQRYFGYFLLFHDQENYGGRLTANIDSNLFDMPMKSIIGFEFSDTDFVRTRGFRRSVAQTATDSVDLRNPQPGVYGPEELRGASPTDIQIYALFGENMIELTSALKLVTALRYEKMDLVRQNFNASGVEEPSGFSRDFTWVSWRVGAVYEITSDFVAYAQYSNAKDPVGANIFLVNSGHDFDLTSATQWEIGAKLIAMDGKLQTTISYYDIERDDAPQVIGRDNVGLIGARSSNGVEFSSILSPVDKLDIGLNAGYTDVEFEASPNAVTFAGNVPANVADWTVSAFAEYKNIADLPVSLGVSAQYVGDRFADHANTITMKSYTLTDLFMRWNINENFRLSFNVDNVFDVDYIPWSDVFYLQQTDPGFIYANQLLLGEPRSYSLTLQARF